MIFNAFAVRKFLFFYYPIARRQQALPHLAQKTARVRPKAPEGKFRIIVVRGIGGDEEVAGDFSHYPQKEFDKLYQERVIDTILIFDDKGTCLT